MLVFLTGLSALASGSGMELIKGELRIVVSSALRPLAPIVCSVLRFVPVMR